MNKNTVISSALVVLILLAGVVFWAFQRGVIYVKDGSLGFSKEAIANPTPSLDRPIVYPADFSESSRELHTSNVAALKTVLEGDPVNHEAWLDLAIYYRMVNDHEGAIEIWEYLRRIYPSDGVSRRNLGEYYFHVAKDYPKAESYYRESVSIAPKLEANYTDLYEMYRYVYKQDTTAATDILKEGIEQLDASSNVYLKVILGRHYRDVLKDKDNARKYLIEARDGAQAAGNRSLANELQREINAL